MAIITRIQIRVNQKVKAPEDLQAYVWDHPRGEAPLEKLILRTFKYGSFHQIRRIYNQYTLACYDIANKYPEVKRGVKFWINDWHG